MTAICCIFTASKNSENSNHDHSPPKKLPDLNRNILNGFYTAPRATSNPFVQMKIFIFRIYFISFNLNVTRFGEISPICANFYEHLGNFWYGFISIW